MRRAGLSNQLLLIGHDDYDVKMMMMMVMVIIMTTMMIAIAMMMLMMMDTFEFLAALLQMHWADSKL